MKIVVLDGYTTNPGDLSWDDLCAIGETTVYDRTPKELAAERIGDADIVFTNKTFITEETLEACPNIRYIGILATGYNIVDVEAAARRGIPVANAAGYGTPAVAQMAFAHLLEICHQIGHHDKVVREGEWARRMDYSFWDCPLIELDGKTMGIIGFGNIGRRTGRIANAFGMNVLAYDAYPNPAYESENIRYVSLDELYASSDVISLHCPLTDDNVKMINRESIAKMKDGVIIINTARGGLVNEEDLAEALNSDKVYAAGIDVVSAEPIVPENPLLKAKNCFLSPHIAWAPSASRKRMLDIAINNLKAFLAGKPENVVNM